MQLRAAILVGLIAMDWRGVESRTAREAGKVNIISAEKRRRSDTKSNSVTLFNDYCEGESKEQRWTMHPRCTCPAR